MPYHLATSLYIYVVEDRCVFSRLSEEVQPLFLKNFTFLDNQLKFLQISEVIEQCTQKIAFIAQPTLDDYIETDFEARNIAIEIIKNIK